MERLGWLVKLRKTATSVANIEWLIDLHNSGVSVPILQEQPEIIMEAQTYWEVWSHVSRSCSIGGGFEGPKFPFTELRAVLQILDIEEREHSDYTNIVVALFDEKLRLEHEDGAGSSRN